MASKSKGASKSISKDGKISRQQLQVNDENAGKEQSPIILHEVEHFKQRYNWDCGLSCVLMVLPPEQRAFFLDNFDTICQEEGFGKSTWTIDLCFLLKRFNIKHCMYSTMMGVNEDYKKFSYYDSIMELDKDRVRSRFDEAESRGIAVREGTVTNDQLREHLTRYGPVIVLVDAGQLVCDLCKHNKLRIEFRRCFGGGSYTGHYVLVVGYTRRRAKLLYRDPALRPRLCAAAEPRLQTARTAVGTDHDIIFIYNS